MFANFMSRCAIQFICRKKTPMMESWITFIRNLKLSLSMLTSFIKSSRFRPPSSIRMYYLYGASIESSSSSMKTLSSPIKGYLLPYALIWKAKEISEKNRVNSARFLIDYYFKAQSFIFFNYLDSRLTMRTSPNAPLPTGDELLSFYLSFEGSCNGFLCLRLGGDGCFTSVRRS